MRCRRSARLTAVARTRTATSPRCGSGAGTSRRSRTSGPPGLEMTMAFMVAPFAHSRRPPGRQVRALAQMRDGRGVVGAGAEDARPRDDDVRAGGCDDVHVVDLDAAV